MVESVVESADFAVESTADCENRPVGIGLYVSTNVGELVRVRG